MTENKDITNIIGYISYPEYSKSPFEIKDEFSLNIAKQILDAIEKKLKEGNKDEPIA